MDQGEKRDDLIRLQRIKQKVSARTSHAMNKKKRRDNPAFSTKITFHTTCGIGFFSSSRISEKWREISGFVFLMRFVRTF